jgi:hypothetical protein
VSRSAVLEDDLDGDGIADRKDNDADGDGVNAVGIADNGRTYTCGDGHWRR